MGADLGDAASWIIVFVGWIVVNHQNNARETRKEIRTSLIELYSVLDGIEDMAFTYHTSPGHDPALARKIKRELSQVNARIVLALRGDLRKTCSYTKQLFKFRQSITLENFETSQFIAKQHSDPFFDLITDAKRGLIFALDKSYNDKYK